MSRFRYNKVKYSVILQLVASLFHPTRESRFSWNIFAHKKQQVILVPRQKTRKGGGGGLIRVDSVYIHVLFHDVENVCPLVLVDALRVMPTRDSNICPQKVAVE